MDNLKKNDVRDYVLMMLGAPVIAIELTDEQIDLCISTTKSQIASLSKVKSCTCQPNKQQEAVLLKSGALIYAKGVLGRIRGKCAGQPIAWGETGYSQLDANQLCEECHSEIKDWKLEVLTYCGYTDWDE